MSPTGCAVRFVGAAVDEVSIDLRLVDMFLWWRGDLDGTSGIRASLEGEGDFRRKFRVPSGSPPVKNKLI